LKEKNEELIQSLEESNKNKNEITSLHKIFKANKNEIHSLKVGISELEINNSNMSEKNEELIQSLEYSSPNFDSFKNEMQKKENEMTSLREEIETKENELSLIQKEMSKKGNEIRSLQEEIENKQN
jgi:chromosome segregation ATPase